MSANAVALLDVGSSAIKAQVRRRGEIVWADEREVETAIDGPRVEHDAEQVARQAATLLGAALEEQQIGGVGLACQRSTCLVWERESGRARTPALSWQDRRETARMGSLAAHAERVRERSGLHLSPHYAAPKLAGLLEADAELARGARGGELVAGTLDAFLRHRLTGRPTTEPTCAGRTLLYDLERDAWSQELCDLFAVPESALPGLTPSTHPGLQIDGRPFLVGLGDQQAALVGHGGLEPGVIAVHFGTGAFVLAGTGRRIRRGSGLLTAVLVAHAESRVFQLEGSINSAGSAVEWARRLAGIDLADWAERTFEPEDVPLVLPAFAGLAAPWWEPRIGAAITDLRLETSGAEILAGTLAGIAQRIADIVEEMRRSGLEITVLRLSGRLSRLRGLVRLVAESSATAVEVLQQEEAGLAGLERLAAAALGEPEPPPAAARVRLVPQWESARRRRLRRRWRRFVESSIAAEHDGP